MKFWKIKTGETENNIRDVPVIVKNIGLLISTNFLDTCKWIVIYYSCIPKNERVLAGKAANFFNTNCSVFDCMKEDTNWVQVHIKFHVDNLATHSWWETDIYSGYVCSECWTYLKFRLDLV